MSLICCLTLSIWPASWKTIRSGFQAVQASFAHHPVYPIVHHPHLLHLDHPGYHDHHSFGQP